MAINFSPQDEQRMLQAGLTAQKRIGSTPYQPAPYMSPQPTLQPPAPTGQPYITPQNDLGFGTTRNLADILRLAAQKRIGSTPYQPAPYIPPQSTLQPPPSRTYVGNEPSQSLPQLPRSPQPYQPGQPYLPPQSTLQPRPAPGMPYITPQPGLGPTAPRSPSPSLSNLVGINPPGGFGSFSIPPSLGNFATPDGRSNVPYSAPQSQFSVGEILRRLAGGFTPRTYAATSGSGRDLTSSIVSALGQPPQDWWNTIFGSWPGAGNPALSSFANF